MSDKIHIRIYSFICVALLMLWGCTEEIVSPSVQDATLKISLNAPSYTADVRSVSSDPDSPQQWTTWERAVDGRFLYRVTAFLLQGNRLVAHKDISLEGEPDRVNLEFEATILGKFYRVD